MRPHKTPIAERAMGRWREILPALGVPAESLGGKHGPCPVCNGKDRFRFDDKDRKGTWFCSQDHGTDTSNSHGSAGNGFALIMDFKQCDFAASARLVESVIGEDSAPMQPSAQPQTDHVKVRQWMKELWKLSARVTDGDPVDLYLRNRVGQCKISNAVRYIERCKHTASGEFHPAMLARITDQFGDSCGLHRTFLTMNGSKANVDPVRMAMGTMPDGCAVRLSDHDKVLGIAEGIETALSASAIYNIPVWAALNAGKLETWRPPEGVNEIVIFGDNDINSVGQAAAYTLAKRLNQTVMAQVILPPDGGTDWNDVLMSRQEQAA